MGGAHVQTIPSNNFIPVITGIPTQGQVLTTTTGIWTQYPTSYAYQWQRDEVAIVGATASTYTLTSADVGHLINVTVTATNTVGTSFPVEARQLGPIASPLTISGTPDTTAMKNQPYTAFTVTSGGGWTPKLYNITSGLLPPGITLNSQTGVVAGVPKESGVYSNIVITVSDRYGLTASLASFTLTVSIINSLDFSDAGNSQYLILGVV